jgi:hypothetical protein
MDRWRLVRNRIEQYLGERSSARERAYRAKREALAGEIGMADVTLKGFLPAKRTKSRKPKSGTLGWDKLQKLLVKREFRDLRRHFPELGRPRSQPRPISYLQLEFDFKGFDVTPQTRIVRLPVGREAKVRLRITKTA